MNVSDLISFNDFSPININENYYDDEKDILNYKNQYYINKWRTQLL